MNNKRLPQTLKKRTPQLGILFFVFLVLNSSSFAFENFTLKNELSELAELENNERKSNSHRKSVIINNIWERIEPSYNTDYNTDKSILDEQENQYNDILGSIYDELGLTYQNIGSAQSENILLNRDLGGGVQNFAGFNWHKPFANFQVSANRKIEQKDDSWIAIDQFILQVKASTLLENLRDQELIEITDTALAAFAEIAFKRIYTTTHKYNTYEQALQSDYEKLFLPFTHFSARKFLIESPRIGVQMLQDQFLVQAGAYLSAPLAYGFNVTGGAAAQVDLQRKIAIEMVPSNQDIWLKASVEKLRSVKVTARLGLYLDLLELLKLTLLSLELDFESEKAVKKYYQLPTTLKHEIIENNDRFLLQKLLRGRPSNQWDDYITTFENRYKNSFESNINLFMYERDKAHSHEQIVLTNDQEESIFFKYFSQSKWKIHSWWSKLLSFVGDGILNLFFNFSSFAEESREIIIEYQNEENASILQATDEEDFTLTLSHHFKAKRTHGHLFRFFRNKASKHINFFTGFDLNLSELVQSTQIRGPLTISTQVTVNKEAIQYFLSLDREDITNAINSVCRDQKRCQKRLNNRYDKFIEKHLEENIYSLKHLKNFLGLYYKYIRHMQDFSLLFGEDNVNYHGTIAAMTKQGLPFQSFFQDKQIDSLGLVDEAYKNL